MFRARGVAAFVVVAATVLACVRAVLPTTEGAPNRSYGDDCTASTQCAEGACVDGVCCRSPACAETQACNLERDRGTCMERLLGDRCTGAVSCRSGFCTDGVCCNSACEGLCLACNRDDDPGHCGLASDNTDPRGQCAGACTACFGGFCAPALPGTDPNNACAAPNACNQLAQCAPRPGAACSAGGPCATGWCMGGVCADGQVEAVTSDALVPTAPHTRILALSVDVSGTPSLVVRQLIPGHDTTADVSTHNVYYLRRTATGWDGLLLAQPDYCTLDVEEYGRHRRAALVSVGTTDVVFLVHGFEDCGEHLPEEPFGLVAYWTGPSFRVQRQEVLVANTGPTVPEWLYHVVARFDGVDRIVLTLGVSLRPLPYRYPQDVIIYRVSGHSWSGRTRVFDSVGAWGASEFVDGEIVSFFGSTTTRLEAVQVADNGTVTPLGSVDLPAGCAVLNDDPVTTTVAPRADGRDEVLLVVRCLDEEDPVDPPDEAPDGGPGDGGPGDGGDGGVDGGSPPLEYRNKLALVTFTRADGFSAPQWRRNDENFRYLSLGVPVRLSENAAGLAAFDTRLGQVRLAQQRADGGWHVDGLAQPILYNEYLHTMFADHGPSGPVLGWTLDVLEPTGATVLPYWSSRVLLLELAHGSDDPAAR